MNAPLPIADRDAEQAVIGCCLLSGRIVEPLHTDIGLRPVHFSASTHGAVWAAMAAMIGTDTQPDAVTLTAALDGEPAPPTGWRELLDLCASMVPSAGNAKAYALRVVEAWRWEHRRRAAVSMFAAIDERDDAAVARAVSETEQVAARSVDRHLTDPAELGEHVAGWLMEPREPGLSLPWPSLERLLKLRPGHTTTWAGWTNIGKSQAADQLAAHTGRSGGHAVLWINEMSREERACRQVVRDTGVNYNHLVDGRVADADATAALGALRSTPFGVVECHGWPALEIAQHIRAVRPDLAVVDHFHALPDVGRTDRADEAVSALVASAAQAGCHLLLVAQLNQSRNQGACRPAPVLRDIRGTGNLFNLPDNVVFVHRQEELLTDTESGESLEQSRITESGHLDIAKQRGGRMGLVVEVEWDPARLRFLERYSR